MSRSVLLALTLAWLPPCGAATAARVEHFDRHIDSARRAWDVPGVAVAVVREGAVVHLAGYGVRDRERGGAMTPDTLFTIASVTKSFTGAALATLAESGRLDLDAPIAKLLPDLQFSDPAVTERVNAIDLLSHRTGTRDTAHHGHAAVSRRALLERVRHYDGTPEFRTGFHYSNVMYVAAGELLTAVTGVGWDEYVVERLLRPAGMTRSSTTARELAADREVAASHVTSTHAGLVVDPFVVDGWWSNDHRGPSASINSTAREMTAWMRVLVDDGAVEGRRVLAPGVTARMFGPRNLMEAYLPATHVAGYGLGLALHDYRGVRVASHGGLYRGHASFMLLAPDRRLGVFVFANSRDADDGFVDGVALWLLDRLLGHEESDWAGQNLRKLLAARAEARATLARFEAARPPVLPASATRESLVGRYANPAWGRWEVRAVGEGLELVSLDAAQPVRAALEPWTGDTYRPRWRELVEDYQLADLVRFVVERGTVTGIRFENPIDTYWGTIHYTRVPAETR